MTYHVCPYASAYMDRSTYTTSVGEILSLGRIRSIFFWKIRYVVYIWQIYISSILWSFIMKLYTWTTRPSTTECQFRDRKEMDLYLIKLCRYFPPNYLKSTKYIIYLPFLWKTIWTTCTLDEVLFYFLYICHLFAWKN